MATSGSSSRVGPVPFKDVENDADTFTTAPERPSEEHAGLVDMLPARLYPELSLAVAVDIACDGTMPFGPFWDHILGYWRAAAAWPESVLFLGYEEMLRDPDESVRRLARFVGLPFSVAEEEAGVVGGIVELCSLESLRGMEANRTCFVSPQFKFPREALLRKGVADDWKNHMTPEMARRMDAVVADKFRGTGLSFP